MFDLAVHTGIEWQIAGSVSLRAVAFRFLDCVISAIRYNGTYQGPLGHTN